MAAGPSRVVKLFGTDVPAAPLRTLTAGPLTAELDAGNLRYIRIGGIEAIRAISFVVRDAVWGTYNPVIEDLRVEESGDEEFAVGYVATCTDERQTLRYRAAITGSADDSLRFEAEVEPLTDFESRRVGFVVLHGLEGVTGRPVRVLHVDGTEERSVFPRLVEPWQPFFDIRALTHEFSPGLEVTCRMEGDDFEMEDHRNWTDASYKTYIRPLAKPAPFTMGAGERSEQAVTLALSGSAPRAASTARSPQPVSVAVGAEAGTMPRIGLGVHPRRAGQALEALDALRRLGPQILVCHLDPRDGHGTADLARFRELGEALGSEIALEAIVPCEGDYREEIGALAGAVAETGVRAVAVAVAPGPDLIAGQPFSDWPEVPPLADLYDATRAAFPDSLIGGGSFSYFTEFNRRRPPVDHLDFVSHVTAAIVHAADDISVTETIEALPYVMATVDDMRAGKPYRIGPSGIASRHHPFGGEPTPNPQGGRVTMTRLDPRQRGLLGAAWHLGYAARTSAGGVDVLALSSAVGEFGLVYRPMEWAQPWFDEAGTGVYPAYHVMAGLAAASGAARLETRSSVPRDVQALAYRDAGSTSLWLANLTGEPREVEVSGLPGGDARACVMDEDSFERCVSGPEGFDAGETAPGTPIALAPYAVVRIRVAGRR
jgi:hypothetical protein